jgi:hypothetical protein
MMPVYKDERVDWKAEPVGWPPRSPDLAPLDFYLWGHLKAKVYAVKTRSVEHLQEQVFIACSEITPQPVHAIFLHVCGHTEHIV